MTDSGKRPADFRGLSTDDWSRGSVAGQLVRWVVWDSPAADALRIGDVIVAAESGEHSLEGADLPRLDYPPTASGDFWSRLLGDLA